MLFNVAIIIKILIEQKILFITLCKVIILNKKQRVKEAKPNKWGCLFFIVQECQIIINLNP